MIEIEYRKQKGATESTGLTGSHGFHGSKLVYTKSSWEYLVQFLMLGVGVAAGIWIKYWLVGGVGILGMIWLVGDMLSMPYDTIQITRKKITLLRKQHIYREYKLQAQDSITLKITRHFREHYHYYRLSMRLHNVHSIVRARGRGVRPTMIRFKHFVSSRHKELLEEVQEIKTFLETRASQQVTVRKSFSLLHSW